MKEFTVARSVEFGFQPRSTYAFQMPVWKRKKCATDIVKRSRDLKRGFSNWLSYGSDGSQPNEPRCINEISVNWLRFSQLLTLSSDADECARSIGSILPALLGVARKILSPPSGIAHWSDCPFRPLESSCMKGLRCSWAIRSPSYFLENTSTPSPSCWITHPKHCKMKPDVESNRLTFCHKAACSRDRLWRKFETDYGIMYRMARIQWLHCRRTDDGNSE